LEPRRQRRRRGLHQRPGRVRRRRHARSFWHWDRTTDIIDFDWQDAYITDSKGNILQTIFHQCGNCQSWVNQTVDLTSYVGQTIRVKFLVHQDGFGALTGMFVDDVQLTLPCGSISPTPAPRATPVPRPRPTPEVAPIAQLENVKAAAHERLAGSPVCAQKDFANMAASTQKSPNRNTSSAFEVSAAASEPFL
jgi:hypothetical protein